VKKWLKDQLKIIFSAGMRELMHLWAECTEKQSAYKATYV
jgi:hypothetical protein